MSKNTQAVIWAIINAGFMAFAAAVANAQVPGFPPTLLWIFPVITAILTAASPYFNLKNGNS